MPRKYFLLLTVLTLTLITGPWTVSAQTGRSNVTALAIDPLSTDTVYAGTRGAGIFKSTNAGNDWYEVNNGIDTGSRTINKLVINPFFGGPLYAGTTGSLYKTINGGDLWIQLSGSIGTGAVGLAMDPYDPSTVYYSSTGLGTLNKTTDGGNSWNLKVVGLSTKIVALDPVTTSTIYLGITAFGSLDKLLKSRDGGDTWDLSQNSFVQPINTLVIDPESPDTFYAGTRFAGVIKSTDGGIHWSPTDVRMETTALVMDPSNPRVIYAGTQGGGVFKTENGGLSWREINVGLTSRSINALAINPKDPSVIYAGAELGGVFKSEDGGITWFHLSL